MNNSHTFHIPVMGTAFTADTPLKVAQYGINSVISIVDDVLLERLRKLYSEQNGYNYTEILKSSKDHRADRITSYLNLINDITGPNVNCNNMAFFKENDKKKTLLVYALNLKKIFSLLLKMSLIMTT